MAWKLSGQPRYIHPSIHPSFCMSPSSPCPLTQNCSLHSQSCCCLRMHLNKCSFAPLMCVSLSESLVPDGWWRDQGCGGWRDFSLCQQSSGPFWPTHCHSALHCHDRSLCVFVWVSVNTVQSCGCRSRRQDWFASAGPVRGEKEVVMNLLGVCLSPLLSSSCIHRPSFTPGSVPASKFVRCPQNLQKQGSCLNVFPFFAALRVSLCLKILFWRPASAEHSEDGWHETKVTLQRKQ